MTNTPHQSEWEQKSVEELGGKLHLILNKTVDGRLTVAEYSKVVKLISAMLRQTEADTRRAVIEEAMAEIQTLRASNVEALAANEIEEVDERAYEAACRDVMYLLQAKLKR